MIFRNHEYNTPPQQSEFYDVLDNATIAYKTGLAIDEIENLRP